MPSFCLRNARIINEGQQTEADLLIRNGRIERIGGDLSGIPVDQVIDVAGKYLLPGVIDDQVHFREPGLTHKAEIYTEARAAVAGGTTTFMEMPNTVPQALTQDLLSRKYQRAAECSLANYSFFMGVSNDNFEEVMRTDTKNVCGLKIFMGSSTGNMLVDDPGVLERVFRDSELLIATHCEDEATIRANEAQARARYGDQVPMEAHAEIRSVAACYGSSSLAIALAQRHNTRLHILHISTADELDLFRNDVPLTQKRITAEVCVHHLWFSSDDYAIQGSRIKCNPAIKAAPHRAALWEALLDDRLDIIATDHAPHTAAEKANGYWSAPSGVPLVQHALLMMLEKAKEGKITLEKVVEKMAHAPAQCFQIAGRGYVREGYWADLVIVDPRQTTRVRPQGLHYKCGWSPLEGFTFAHAITHTFVSGHLAYAEGRFDESVQGQRVVFDR
ncbi:MAG: dihydroorotase [Bernardetiaceae bacterium]